MFPVSPPPGDMYPAESAGTEAQGSTEPDYWHGVWYDDIKSMVYAVALSMHDHGVDPERISADDAWAHMAGNIRAGHRQMELAGTTIPAEYVEFVKADSAGGRVFMAMWQFYDLHKLIQFGMGAQK